MLNLKTKTALISQKNTTLLFFEALACMMIVFIHCQFPGNFGIIMNGFARFGVPLFYVVSGFFLVKDEMTVEELRQKLKKRAIRITFLLLFSFVIYFILDAIGICLGSSKTPFLIYLKDLFHWRKILILLICNDPLTSAISWFLIAMLFSYLIIYIFPNVFLKNKVIPIVLSCLCVFWIIFRIIVVAADVSLFGVKLANDIIYRSWYANGLLFISLGVVLKRNEKKIKNIPLYLVVPLLILFMVLAPLEHYLIYRWLNSGLSYYFCNIISVILIIIVSVKKPDLFSKDKILNQEGNWTMFVYVFHPALITITGLIFKLLQLTNNPIILWTKPIIVLFLSVFIAIIFNLLFVKFKNRSKARKLNA